VATPGSGGLQLRFMSAASVFRIMSMIATIREISEQEIQSLISALGSEKAPMHSGLPGVEIAQSQQAGFVVAMAMEFLGEQGFDLDDLQDLATAGSEQTDSTWFLIPGSKRAAAVERLEGLKFTKKELRDFYNEFNEADEPDEIGDQMADAIEFVSERIRKADSRSTLLIHIG
jgi:hypothetical protein